MGAPKTLILNHIWLCILITTQMVHPSKGADDCIYCGAGERKDMDKCLSPCIPCDEDTWRTEDFDQTYCLPCMDCGLMFRIDVTKCFKDKQSECGRCIDGYYEYPYMPGESWLVPCLECDLYNPVEECEDFLNISTTEDPAVTEVDGNDDVKEDPTIVLPLLVLIVGEGAAMALVSLFRMRRPICSSSVSDVVYGPSPPQEITKSISNMGARKILILSNFYLFIVITAQMVHPSKGADDCINCGAGERKQMDECLSPCIPCDEGTWRTEEFDQTYCLPCMDCSLMYRVNVTKCLKEKNRECGGCMDGYCEPLYLAGESLQMTCLKCDLSNPVKEEDPAVTEVDGNDNVKEDPAIVVPLVVLILGVGAATALVILFRMRRCICSSSPDEESGHSTSRRRTAGSASYTSDNGHVCVMTNGNINRGPANNMEYGTDKDADSSDTEEMAGNEPPSIPLLTANENDGGNCQHSDQDHDIEPKVNVENGVESRAEDNSDISPGVNVTGPPKGGGQ